MIKKSKRTSATVIACCALICLGVTVLLYCSGITLHAGRASLRGTGYEAEMNWYGAAFISLVLISLLVAVIVAK